MWSRICRMWHDCTHTCSIVPIVLFEMWLLPVCFSYTNLSCLQVLMQAEYALYKLRHTPSVKDSTAISQQFASSKSSPFLAGQDNQLCARCTGQKLHAGGQKCVLGTEYACWGHELHAGDTNSLLRTKMHAGDSLDCDRSSSDRSPCQHN